jgi:hypothetical protein
MPRRLLLTLIALGLTMALTAAPLSAGGLGTLDQQQTDADNAHDVAGSLETAQVFTAGITGQLDHVDLWLSTGPGGGPGGPGGPLTTDLTVEIWTVASGAPDAPIPGASASVALADVPQGPALWVQVPISAPSVAGTEYAIVLSAPAESLGSCPDDCWQWLFQEDTPPYAGGAAYTSSDSGANWAALAANEPAADFAFRTYVTVAAAPTPVASLVDAATAAPSAGTPLATLGFALLLIGSLGTLAVVSVRAAVSRR